MKNKKLLSEQKSTVRITNDDLVCKDCLYKMDDSEKFGNTSKCFMFPNSKPNKVLLGGSCIEYKEER